VLRPFLPFRKLRLEITQIPGKLEALGVSSSGARRAKFVARWVGVCV
jgi:hypothetical protein